MQSKELITVINESSLDQSYMCKKKPNIGVISSRISDSLYAKHQNASYCTWHFINLHIILIKKKVLKQVVPRKRFSACQTQPRATKTTLVVKNMYPISTQKIISRIKKDVPFKLENTWM